MTWSPVSFGLCPGDKSEDATQFFIKLQNKVKLGIKLGLPDVTDFFKLAIKVQLIGQY